MGMELVLGLEDLQVEQNSTLGQLIMTLTTSFILWALVERWTGIDQEIIPVVAHLQLQDHKYLLHVLSHLTFSPLLLCGLVEYSLIGCDEYPFSFINITLIVGME